MPGCREDCGATEALLSVQPQWTALLQTMLPQRTSKMPFSLQKIGDKQRLENLCSHASLELMCFHDTLKQTKSLTLKNMYMVENKKNVFQRLLIAKDSGRKVDLKRLLCHELSPVPLALADTAGRLRPTNKAELGKVLQEGVSFEALPETNLKTCTIIDGQALVQAIGKSAGAKTFGDLDQKHSHQLSSAISVPRVQR